MSGSNSEFSILRSLQLHILEELDLAYFILYIHIFENLKELENFNVNLNFFIVKMKIIRFFIIAIFFISSLKNWAMNMHFIPISIFLGLFLGGGGSGTPLPPVCVDIDSPAFIGFKC